MAAARRCGGILLILGLCTGYIQPLLVKFNRLQLALWVAQNKLASFEYEFEEKYEAGIQVCSELIESKSAEIFILFRMISSEDLKLRVAGEGKYS